MPFHDLVIGTDVVDLARLGVAYRRHGALFFQKILTPAEWACCQGFPEPRLLSWAGGRIAVKEAVSKALGVGINGLGWGAGISWHSVEVLPQTDAPPTLALTGEARQKAEERGIAQWRLSLSHDGGVALATVIGLVDTPAQGL